ncbi:unnamed protein product [Soboliphyme baturini]|uniref:Ig-like domain-containing protein n=1 Tax=Soboliphyme baturini TaxID=241478 RepID=A0A183ISL4_9BILA|nr:unnamed protein product [Soboliphyme baturini]
MGGESYRRSVQTGCHRINLQRDTMSSEYTTVAENKLWLEMTTTRPPPRHKSTGTTWSGGVSIYAQFRPELSRESQLTESVLQSFYAEQVIQAPSARNHPSSRRFPRSSAGGRWSVIIKMPPLDPLPYGFLTLTAKESICSYSRFSSDEVSCCSARLFDLVTCCWRFDANWFNERDWRRHTTEDGEGKGRGLRTWLAQSHSLKRESFESSFVRPFFIASAIANVVGHRRCSLLTARPTDRSKPKHFPALQRLHQENSVCCSFAPNSLAFLLSVVHTIPAGFRWLRRRSRRRSTFFNASFSRSLSGAVVGLSLGGSVYRSSRHTHASCSLRTTYGKRFDSQARWSATRLRSHCLPKKPHDFHRSIDRSIDLVTVQSNWRSRGHVVPTFQWPGEKVSFSRDHLSTLDDQSLQLTVV